MKLIPRPVRRGFTLIEALVYITVLAAILGLGYTTLARLWTSSGYIRRESDDLRAVLATGERWREDTRRTAVRISNETANQEHVLTLQPPDGSPISWAFHRGRILRRTGATNDWMELLDRVRSSTVTEESRGVVNAWRWDLELEPVSKKSRFRRQFSFLAVPNPTKP